MGNLQFEPLAFFENLKWMGLGMLGVFIIIGFIIFATSVTNYVINKRTESKKDDE